MKDIDLLKKRQPFLCHEMMQELIAKKNQGDESTQPIPMELTQQKHQTETFLIVNFPANPN